MQKLVYDRFASEYKQAYGISYNIPFSQAWVKPVSVSSVAPKTTVSRVEQEINNDISNSKTVTTGYVKPLSVKVQKGLVNAQSQAVTVQESVPGISEQTMLKQYLDELKKSTKPTGLTDKDLAYIDALFEGIEKKVSLIPEYLENTISDYDKSNVKRLYDIDKVVKESAERARLYAEEEAIREKKYWASEDSKMEKLLQSLGYLSSPDYLQRVSEKVEVGPLVKPIIKEVVNEALIPTKTSIQELNEGIKYIKENVSKIGYGAMRGAGDLLEDIGVSELKDVVNTIQDQGVRYLAGLAASQAAFKQAEVQMTKLSEGYKFGLGSDPSQMLMLQDQINNSIQQSMQIPLQSFAESLGQFRGIYNTMNMAISGAQSSGKYRYSKTPRNGYLKSKHGNYYYQLIR